MGINIMFAIECSNLVYLASIGIKALFYKWYLQLLLTKNNIGVLPLWTWNVRQPADLFDFCIQWERHRTHVFFLLKNFPYAVMNKLAKVSYKSPSAFRAAPIHKERPPFGSMRSWCLLVLSMTWWFFSSNAYILQLNGHLNRYTPQLTFVAGPPGACICTTDVLLISVDWNQFQWFHRSKTGADLYYSDCMQRKCKRNWFLFRFQARSGAINSNSDSSVSVLGYLFKKNIQTETHLVL